jgi:hypothetical protein
MIELIQGDITALDVDAQHLAIYQRTLERLRG